LALGGGFWYLVYSLRFILRFEPLIIWLIPLAVLGMFARGVHVWLRSAATVRPTPMFPEVVAAALERMQRSLPAIAQPRHRASLRGVVDRTVRLSLRASEDARLQGQLATAIDIAVTTTARLDAIDRTLPADIRRSADERTRSQLRERDQMNARLMSVTSALDNLAHAAPDATEGEADRQLDELRARVLALEEVQRL
jgi:hypothetical protein